jgi:putative DNA primase/helicase
LEMEIGGVDFKAATEEVDRLVGRGAPKPTKRIVAQYDYTDESGALLFQCVRFEPKNFQQRRPDGNGGWIWNLKGIRMVPYRLPRLLAAETVYVVEGEKDVETLESIGLVATCNPMGAGKWREAYNEYLRGRYAVIVPDSDAPGERHASKVAHHLTGVAHSVRIVKIPAGKDVTEWLSSGGTAEEFQRLVAETKPFVPELNGNKTESGPVSVGAGLVQELERAIRKDHYFARDEGDRLYMFEGGVYRSAGERCVKHAVKRYLESAGKAKSWSPELASKVVEYLTLDAPVLWEHPPLDRVNVRNGLLDVKTRVLSPHSQEFLSPVQIDVEFDSAAKCPAIEQFIEDVFPEDSRHHIPYEIAAWLMLPDTSIQKAVLAVGEGANGKSVFLTLLEDFLGKENVSSVALHKIESDKFAASRLVGKLANICADLPTAALAGTSMFKALCGGDLINAERKFQPSFEFRPYARLVFSANSLPRSDDATHGFFRRWLVLPFDRTFNEGDPGWVPHPVLKARLRAELSGLLNRALDVLPRVQAGTFTESPSLRNAWDQFRRTTDPLSVWLEHNTVDGPDSFVPKHQLRELFAADCRDNGRPILPDAVFTERLRRLKQRVTTGQKTAKKTWCFLGIGLRTSEYESQEPNF